MDNFELLEIPEDYDSPFNLAVSQIAEQMAAKIDEGVMQAVANVGISVDKDKLVRILQQDKERYSEGYENGYRKGYEKRDNEIVRCKDCDNKECWGRAGDVVCGIDGTPHRPDWFCAYGVRKEEDEED